MGELASVVVIPHREQRYATTGDWVDTDGLIEVAVSDLGDWRFNALVGIHEVVEALICRQMGIREVEVTQFDIEYEAAREGQISAPCGCIPTATSEPGDDIHAPYHLAHRAATAHERMLSRSLAVDWDGYEQANLDV